MSVSITAVDRKRFVDVLDQDIVEEAVEFLRSIESDVTSFSGNPFLANLINAIKREDRIVKELLGRYKCIS